MALQQCPYFNNGDLQGLRKVESATTRTCKMWGGRGDAGWIPTPPLSQYKTYLK